MLTPLPQGLSLEDQGNSFKIIRKWFSFTHIFTFIFSLFWNSFLVFWYSLSINMFLEEGSDESMLIKVLPLVFPLIHVGVGVGLLYFSLAGFFNKTIIEVDNGLLKVVHTPLPWWGNIRISTTEIRQLYCQEKISRGRNGTSTSYTVNIVLQNNKSIPLVKGLAEKDQARYIEQQIEERLHISNEPVAGEMDC